VNDVVAETGLTQPTVSRHLSSLHDSSVASRRKDGNRALYVITDRTLTDICRTACVSLVAREEELAAQAQPIRERAGQFMSASVEAHSSTETFSQRFEREQSRRAATIEP
jgi:DNA-binding MarR family transcriptional regulator